MKKILLFVAAALLAVSASATDMYLRGDVNGWGATDEWKFTTTDDVTFVLEKSFTLTGSFKFADADWSEACNYGSAGEPAIIGTFAIAAGSQTNISPAQGTSLSVTKITVDIMSGTCTIEGGSGKDEFDVSKDYEINFNQYFADETQNISDAMDFKGNGKYEVTVVLQQQEYGCKFADAKYSPINYGHNGSENTNITLPYSPAKGASGNIWFDEEASMPQYGSSYKITLTIDKDWNATATFEISTDAPTVKAAQPAQSWVWINGVMTRTLEDGSVITTSGQFVK